MDFKLRQANAPSGPGKAHIDSLKQVMHSVKTLPTGLYGITSDEFGQTHPQSAKIFLEAGVRIIQYRGKGAAERELPVRQMLEDAKAIRKLCTDHGAIFIVDDRLDIANASGADGLHLGQEDMPIEEAKEQFGGIIGVSAKTPEQAIEAQNAGARYLGCGAVFPTKRKLNDPVMGIGGLERIVKSVSIPVYGIGGINIGNVGLVKKAGPYGVAVISGVLAEQNPIAAARTIMGIWDSEHPLTATRT